MYRGMAILQLGEDRVYDVVINDRIAEGIAKPLAHSQPGMFMAETQAGSQTITPLRRVDVLIEVVIQITLHTFRFQPANGTTRLTAGFLNVIDNRVRQWSLNPFAKEFITGNMGNS